MQRVTFDNNQSIGGTGPNRGGVAYGAMSIFFSTVTVEDCIFTNNLAQAGSSTGSGINGGLHADALGGAISIENGKGSPPTQNGTITLNRLTISGNQVKGGNASTTNGTGGGAYGAAIVVEYTTLFSISDSSIVNNTATAGTGHTGGNTGGGGIHAADNSQLSFDRVTVNKNSAIGGNGASGGNSGPGSGGGMYLFATRAGSHHATLNNVIIAENQAYQGTVGVQSLGNGSGGGLQIDGLAADINHATIVSNHIGSNMVLAQGLEIQPWNGTTPALAASVNLNYSIIADHTGGDTRASAIVVVPGSTLTINKDLFADNTINTNENSMPIAPGTINGLNTVLTATSAGFVSPGSPDYNYHLLSTSPAIDQATGSTTPVDIDNHRRPFGAISDIGADEYETSGHSANQHYIYLPFVRKQ